MTALHTERAPLGVTEDRPVSGGVRTIWGLDPVALHHRFWAAHGIQVVRQGEPSEIVDHAELYLLTDPRSLVLFRMMTTTTTSFILASTSLSVMTSILPEGPTALSCLAYPI